MIWYSNWICSTLIIIFWIKKYKYHLKKLFWFLNFLFFKFVYDIVHFFLKFEIKIYKKIWKKNEISLKIQFNIPHKINFELE